MTAHPHHTAIVILNYNGWQDTLACVQSILGADLPVPVSIVVADNASTDGSWEKLVAGLSAVSDTDSPLLQLNKLEAERGDQAQAPTGRSQIVLIANGGNLGFAGGCNPGIRWAMAAGAQFVWLLNNDTEIDCHALGALLKRFEGRPQQGLCGSKLVYHASPGTLQARGGAIFDPVKAVGCHIGVGEPVSAPEDASQVEAQMQYVVGASMMASRAFIERVGVLTEDYLLYFEELDWALRGKQMGFTLGYAPDSLVFHKEGATIGSDHSSWGSPLSHRFLSRNRLLFTQRFYPQYMGSVRRRMLFETLVCLKHRQFIHARIIIEALLGRPVKLPS